MCHANVNTTASTVDESDMITLTSHHWQNMQQDCQTTSHVTIVVFPLDSIFYKESDVN